MSDALIEAYSAALDALQRTGPTRRLHDVAAMLGDPSFADGTALSAHLRRAGPEDALRQHLALALARWDRANTDAEWIQGTAGNTIERRRAITSALGIDEATAHLFADLFPFAAADAPIVIADEWEPWRTPQRRTERSFYWDHYRRYLLTTRKWSPTAVARLDEATEEVVSRLSDPTRQMAYQAKGLVIGYVQSGKTANFTGVVAKAIDVGYRLVIVLTGTTNMLRAQTQRRLDMELCGHENLELEISVHDSLNHDYRDDPDWINGRFVRHGGRPSDTGHPDIRRLSNHAGDYRRLRQGFSALEFVLRERNRPIYDPVNLYTSDARLVVAKKNSTVLRNLVNDLGRIADRLGDVPVLLVDDESDQASVNTTSPSRWRADSKERTAINGWIGKLLRMMPRAQYVGYTATPYANVFIDPSDIEDIFPRDFLIALPRPDGYMGADDFHDLDTDLPLSERLLDRSKERAHVRLLSEDPDEGELRRAIDMFVLTGAVKIHRERLGHASYRHHTMLVHEAMGRIQHRNAAEVIATLWNTGGYYTTSGLVRLRELYLSDVLPVSCALTELPTPSDFSELGDDLAEALHRIRPSDGHASPVIVVNSDKDLESQQESLDFDKRSIWRIIVGGNKLARGFTIEGLTVTYYRRTTKQVDTLMQMGRWFGFRHNYQDLVRLYTTPDLHAMFEAAWRDEDFLRNELRQYATPASGGRQITPRQVPPLIAQHRPDLRPTGRNKMWNAQLVEKRVPGGSMEPVAYPKAADAMRRNTERWSPILASADRTVTFKVPDARDAIYLARVANVTNENLVAVLGKLEWLTDDTFAPQLAWLRGLTSDQLASWVVILPYQTRTTTRRTILGHGPFSIFQRDTSGTGSLRVFSEARHRNAARIIAGVKANHPDGPKANYPDPMAEKLHADQAGAVVLYPVTTSSKVAGHEDGPIDPSAVTIGFHMVTPKSSAPTDGRLVKWTTRDSSNPRAIAIEVPDNSSH